MTIRPDARSAARPARHLDELAGADGDFLARRAPAAIADDAVARREAGDVRTDAFNGAGEFRPRRERIFRLVLVLAGDDQEIEEIQRGGLDPDHGLSGPGDRVG